MRRRLLVFDTLPTAQVISGQKGNPERGGGGERPNERERERQRDRQTDRQTEQRFRTGTKTPISTQLIKDPHLNPANH